MALTNPVQIERYPANRQGPDISSPLILSEDAAVARGTAEIDKNCSNRAMVQLQSWMIPWLSPGEVVQVTDHEEGQYLAMVDTHAITLTRSGREFTADSNLIVEKVTE